MIDWIASRLNPRAWRLQDRLAFSIGIAVAAAVALTGVAAYFITMWSLYDQLDQELVEVATVTSGWIQQDIEQMGGINGDALKAVNVSVVVLRSDNQTTTVRGEQATLVTGARELMIARIQTGYSARSGVATDGQPYRIVAVPLATDTGHHYALVLGRPLGPTEGILHSLWLVLIFVGLAGVLLAAGAGWLIARSGVRPVRRLTAAVTHVTETDELTPIAIVGSDELAELTRSFNTMLNSLASSRDRQRRLIADAGHELRTPLTSMRTNIELLVADERSGMLPPGARGEILRDVAAQLGEFTTLVGDLVQLSREDAVHPNPEPIDLRDVVGNAISRAQRRGPGIKFDVELHPLFLVGEPDTLERAFTNLLDNAVKFSPPDGTIHVRLKGDRLRISDEGPGIADEDLPHVFDRFYRSEKARTTPGTGLGLSIVMHTIKAHGGWVSAGRSATGGAEFVVQLPGAITPDGAAPASDEETVPLPRPAR